MKPEIKKLVDNYLESEKKLQNVLNDLGNDECICDISKSREIIRTIHEGNFPEIITRCLNCGGVTDE